MLQKIIRNIKLAPNKIIIPKTCNVNNLRWFNTNKYKLEREVGKEASKALSVSSNRIKDLGKISKRNSLRRMRNIEDEEVSIYDPSLDVSFLDQYPKSICQAYCTSEEYDMEILLKNLNNEFKINNLTSDVFHLNSSTSKEFKDSDIFLFRGGTFVMWSSDASLAEKFLDLYIRKDNLVEKGSYHEYETEQFFYFQNSQFDTQILADYILIGGKGDAILTKLAFSHGLARSAKLTILEDMLDNLLESMNHYPIILASSKKINITKKEIFHKIGQVFLLRGILNLQSESFLDTPDFYWSKPQLEACYDSISRNLDVRPRIAILNKKLDYANQLTDLLREQLSEAHSNKLEWCIILLIGVEVLFESVRYYERYNQRNNIIKNKH